jgi:hypothetical protein
MYRLSDEQTLELRRLYELTTLPLDEIARGAGITRSVVSGLARRKGWGVRPGGRGTSGGRPRSHVGKKCPGLAECPERSALVARVWAAASGQVAEIETRMVARLGPHGGPYNGPHGRLLGAKAAAGSPAAEARGVKASGLKSAGLKSSAAVGAEARAMAVLVRTLRDLTALDRETGAMGRDDLTDGAAHARTNETKPDGLAEELARRLEGLRKRGKADRASLDA